jgi:hypothetical protein
VVTTVTVREKDRPLEESGGIVMTVRSWTTDDDSAGERRSTIFETTSELLNIDNAPDTSVVMITANFREK